MSFAENLKKAMNEAGINQKRLQELTGLSKSGISQYCSGKVKPGKDAMQMIADALNVPVDKLNESVIPTAIVTGNTMTVEEAARLMGVGRQFIREGLKRGSLPIGTAVLFPSGKYRYYISTARFTEFTGLVV